MPWCGGRMFIDEMHAAIPSHLWPQAWRWLETWTRDWGGHLVLASGSLPRFWELNEYRELIRGNSTEAMPPVPDLVQDAMLRREIQNAEEGRVRFRRRAEKHALDCGGLIEFISSKEMPGPRLLIVNTVQTAAVVAQTMREAGHDVLHLSTALAPAHRNLIVERVKRRLRDRIENWTLVATSCVEAGMDFSFRKGFRERASAASLIQVGGRVGRGDEYEDAEVWDLLLRDDMFRHNPALTVARSALGSFSEQELNPKHSATLSTAAMKREWTAGAGEQARKLIDDEAGMEYRPVGPPDARRGVAHLCRVIPQETLTVVIDPGLSQAVKARAKVSRLELLRYSVQMWPGRVRDLGLELLGGEGEGQGAELYGWGSNAYDSGFLGYMAGVLQNKKLLGSPDGWIV